MQTISRIPKLKEFSLTAATMWFSEMHNQGLLFHPEDDPADILRIADGKQTFTEIEVAELRHIMGAMESMLGHENVIEAAYPVFMRVFNKH